MNQRKNETNSHVLSHHPSRAQQPLGIFCREGAREWWFRFKKNVGVFLVSFGVGWLWLHYSSNVLTVG